MGNIMLTASILILTGLTIQIPLGIFLLQGILKLLYRQEKIFVLLKLISVTWKVQLILILIIIQKLVLAAPLGVLIFVGHMVKNALILILYFRNHLQSKMWEMKMNMIYTHLNCLLVTI